MIAFDRVTVRYRGVSQPAVDGVTLRAAAGAMTAVPTAVARARSFAPCSVSSRSPAEASPSRVRMCEASRRVRVLAWLPWCRSARSRHFR
jgi:hypothetical protein